MCRFRDVLGPLSILSFAVVAASALSAQTLQITSPSMGAVVNPGQSVAVTVSATGVFQQIFVVGADPIGISQTLSSPPYQFAIQIPTSILPGAYLLTAEGVISAGQGVSSDPITIDVERPDTPVSLAAKPSIFHFATVGQQGFVDVFGTFPDGSSAYLTQSTMTAYSSGGVVTASSDGIITAVSSGTDTVQITYGSLSVSIPVTVDPPLNIAPSAKVLYGGQTQQFTAQPAGLTTPTINWSITPTGNSTASSIGSIDQTGRYTAPASVTTQQTLTVTVTNAADNTQSASAAVTVNLPVLINVVPSTASLGPSQTQGFGAIVLNAPFTDVVWNLPSGSPGSLDMYGHYTAPSSISSTQTVTIEAISAMDGTTTGSATVTLNSQVPAPILEQDITPSPATGTNVIFSIQDVDGASAADISSVGILINNDFSTQNACYLEGIYRRRSVFANNVIRGSFRQ